MKWNPIRQMSQTAVTRGLERQALARDNYHPGEERWRRAQAKPGAVAWEARGEIISRAMRGIKGEIKAGDIVTPAWVAIPLPHEGGTLVGKVYGASLGEIPEQDYVAVAGNILAADGRTIRHVRAGRFPASLAADLGEGYALHRKTRELWNHEQVGALKKAPAVSAALERKWKRQAERRLSTDPGATPAVLSRGTDPGADATPVAPTTMFF